MKRQRGFTIIEVMIAIALVAILLVQGVPSFRGWLQNAQIRTAAESILNGLQLARAEAVKNNAMVRFSGAAGASWTVGCVTADRDGDGVEDCPAVIQARSASDGTANAAVTFLEISSVTGLTDNAPVFVGNLTFNGRGRAVTGDPAFNPNASMKPANNAAYAVSLTNTTSTCVAAGGTLRCMRIVVSPGGQVRMCDPALNVAANPMGC